MLRSIGREPEGGDMPLITGWTEIGLRTRSLYESALVSHTAGREAA